MIKLPNRIVIARSRGQASGWIGEENYDTWDYVSVHVKDLRFSSEAIQSTVILSEDDGNRTFKFVFSKSHYGDFMSRNSDGRFLLGRSENGTPMLVLETFYPKALPPIGKTPDRKPDVMQEILVELKAIRKLLEAQT